MRTFQKLFVDSLARTASLLIFLMLATLLSQSVASAQKKDQKNAPTVAPTMKRTTSRHEVRRFNYGSSLTIVGAPAGSITVEAWPKSEVDISAI